MTEEEVEQGIFHNDCPNRKVLCYQRVLDGLAEGSNDKDAGKYIDLDEQKKPDKRATQLRYIGTIITMFFIVPNF